MAVVLGDGGGIEGVDDVLEADVVLGDGLLVQTGRRELAVLDVELVGVVKHVAIRVVVYDYDMYVYSEVGQLERDKKGICRDLMVYRLILTVYRHVVVVVLLQEGDPEVEEVHYGHLRRGGGPNFEIGEH